MPKHFPVAVINESSVLSADEVRSMSVALQHQVIHDFAPFWGVGAHVFVVPPGEQPPPGSWWLVFLDDSDQAGALGYHDLTPDLLPIGKVFAATDAHYNLRSSVTASHELLEMLGDPHINLTAYDTDTERLYAYETADAVEADDLGYPSPIDGILVSDFVTPAFFDPAARGKSLQFDFTGHIQEPFALAPGGYLSYLDLHSIGQGWQQVTAEHDAVSGRAVGFPDGSRRQRRRRLWEMDPGLVPSAPR